jgi:hypothetical protein
MSRRASRAILGVLLAGCAAPPPPRAPVETAPRPLWELAPEGAAIGVVIHDGALARGLDLFDTLRVREASAQLGTAPSTKDAVATLGIDPTLGAAVFAWPQNDRGLLVILPVRDRASLGKLTKMRTITRDGRAIDELGNGYVCAPAAGRYLCARSLADLDAAAAPHESGLARAVARLPAEDRGDIEVYASPRASPIAHLRERVRPFGLLTGLTAALRIRPDGGSARMHLLGSTEAGAKALAGTPPLGLGPIAAGATTVVRARFDARSLVPPSVAIEPRMRTELVEQLAGDVEMATSGSGVAAASLVAPVRDPARVERFVKERCAEAGGSMRKLGLTKIAVTDHGCSARFDPVLMLLPVAVPPIPLSLVVEGQRLVLLVGDAREPTPDQRAWETLVAGDEAKRALTGAAALVMLTRRPIIGPDVAPAKAFKEMIPFIGERATSLIDMWGDLGAHVYQALLTARIADDGIVFYGDFTTFAPDPPDARAAYEAALLERSRGDEARYRAALADIEQRFPGTRAARRAAEVKRSTPYLGAGALSLAAIAGLLLTE